MYYPTTMRITIFTMGMMMSMMMVLVVMRTPVSITT
jgi:hypothetical protein